MLVEKSGHAEFRAFSPETQQRWRIRATEYVTPRQAYFMAQDPSMVRALAHHIAGDLRARGYGDIEVFADAFASVNGRASRRLLCRDENLAGCATRK
jgi:vitamin K-dependent gamma-carboxylase